MDPNIKLVKDISYIDDDSIDHQLDIHYISDHTRKPILINIHGGDLYLATKKWILYLLIFWLKEAWLFQFELSPGISKFNVFDQIEDISMQLLDHFKCR